MWPWMHKTTAPTTLTFRCSQSCNRHTSGGIHQAATGCAQFGRSSRSRQWQDVPRAIRRQQWSAFNVPLMWGCGCWGRHMPCSGVVGKCCATRRVDDCGREHCERTRCGCCRMGGSVRGDEVVGHPKPRGSLRVDPPSRVSLDHVGVPTSPHGHRSGSSPWQVQLMHA